MDKKDPLLKIEYDKTKYEIKYLEHELQHVKAILGLSSEEFEKNLKIATKMKGARPPEPDQAPEAEADPAQPDRLELETTRSSKEAKDLYKKIASKTHPDKLIGSTEEERTQKTASFLSAGKALKEDRLSVLSDIALDLGIQIPPPSDDSVALLASETEILKAEISKLKNSWAYLYASESDIKKRDQIMMKFVDFLLTN